MHYHVFATSPLWKKTLYAIGDMVCGRGKWINPFFYLIIQMNTSFDG